MPPFLAVESPFLMDESPDLMVNSLFVFRSHYFSWLDPYVSSLTLMFSKTNIAFKYIPWRIRMSAIYGNKLTINKKPKCSHIYIYTIHGSVMGMSVGDRSYSIHVIDVSTPSAAPQEPQPRDSQGDAKREPPLLSSNRCAINYSDSM